jgi:hypothetical protein
MVPTGWKPRCALRVSVIGNRRFGDSDEATTPEAEQIKSFARVAMHALWNEIFAGVEAALDYELPRAGSHGPLQMRDLFSADRPRLAVLTSLAAGADQIGAATALDAAKGSEKIDVELEAILPFPEEDYPGLPDARREEFREDEAEELRRLAVAATQVVRLNGDYRSKDSRDGAYVQARDLLLHNADIVIAIYRPDAPGGTAGTIESVKRAREQRIPVIEVLLSDGEPRYKVHSESSESDWQSGVRACVREQIVLPEALDAGRDEKIAATLKDVYFRMALLNGKAQLPLPCRTPYTTFFGVVWNLLLRLFGPVRPNKKKTVEDDDKPGTREPALQPYAGFYHLASPLADAYIRTYRGAFVSSFLLAGFAVAAAVTLMAVSLIAVPEHPSPVVMGGLCVIKVGILLGLLRLERAAHRDKWQEAGADFRYLTELLRPIEWLTPLGSYPPAVDLPLHTPRHDARRSWMAWLARAAARSTPCFSMKERCGTLPSKEISLTNDFIATVLDRARTCWLQGQIRYHEGNASRMRTLRKGLERVSRRLVRTVLIAAVLACAIELSSHSKPWLELAVGLGAIAASLPAFVAAFAGISFQSEAKRLAMRSESMLDALLLYEKELAHEAERIRTLDPRHSSAFSTAAAVLKRVSKTTIEEAGDWKVFYQAHEVHAA